jgi:phage gp36-like protein
MSYATQADLVDRYGETELVQLTDRAGLGVVDTVVLGKALADADAEIDRYLASRYAVPLTTVPATITRAAAELARYFLFAAAGAVPEPIKDRYTATVRWLEQIAKGALTLGVELTAPTDSGGTAEMTSSDALWSRSDEAFI